MNQKFVHIACLTLGLIGWPATAPGQVQTPPANLPAGVQDVVRLTRAGMTEEVILAQLKSAGASYNLTADELIYLSNQGVSQNVIQALIQANDPVPAVTPGSSPRLSFEYFHDLLAPYGTWLQVPTYGWCWRPTAATTDLNWRPYAEEGHWLYTEWGWFWHSDYSWGQITFHYGRWFRDNVSWVWAPGYDWAPAWVCWREAEGYLGWAPVPPPATFKAGVGLQWDGRPALDIGFGLGPEAFTFVPCDHFWDRHLRNVILAHDQADAIFKKSLVKNGYRLERGRFIVEGVGRERVAALTHSEVKVEIPVLREVKPLNREQPDGKNRRTP